jgi:hypothetical protein
VQSHGDEQQAAARSAKCHGACSSAQCYATHSTERYCVWRMVGAYNELARCLVLTARLDYVQCQTSTLG